MDAIDASRVYVTIRSKGAGKRCVLSIIFVFNIIYLIIRLYNLNFNNGSV